MSDVPTFAHVRVVTDSTAGLPERLTRPLGMGVIPLQVSLGERHGDEGMDVTTADVVAALSAHHALTTSQPPPAAFESAWGHAPAVVSVHLSSAMSGTCAAARRAAAGMPTQIEVVDAGTTGMGLGFVALAAGRVAAAGGTVAEVAAAAREAARQTDTIFCLDSTEALTRGGRLAGASIRLDSALAVKPLLHVVAGSLVPLERVRTWGRALERLEQVAVERTEGGRAELAVLHLASPLRAEQLARRLDERLGTQLVELEVVEVGASVGAHVGLGCVGVAVHRL